jgi:glutamine transport system substrate-binding protein
MAGRMRRVPPLALLAIMLMTGAAQAKTLTVAIGLGFVPFEFKQNGKMVGFDVDLWDAIAKDLGSTYTIQSMDFNSIIPALQTGEADAAISTISINEVRKRAIDFSDSYYRSDLLFMVPANSRLKGATDIAGKTIAVKTGTTGYEYAKTHFPNARLHRFPNGENAYLEVITGRADASLQDKPNVLYFIKTNGRGLVKSVGGSMRPEDYGIGFPKGSNLREPVNKSLAKIKANGTYATIYRKWFGTEPPAN